ncbi:hypothetical protein TcBrA4_0069820 [Trypanosoma cruzi]|nr:hypothetical protein TcBrA4_0069820 [Trypanosoma cruzi]
MLVCGPCTVVQASPWRGPPQHSRRSTLIRSLPKSRKAPCTCTITLVSVSVLAPTMPRGAMYLMSRIEFGEVQETSRPTVEFFEKLLEEKTGRCCLEPSSMHQAFTAVNRRRAR